MSEITDISELSGEPITEAQLWGVIRGLQKQIFNLACGNGTFGAVDEEDKGAAGHKSYPSRTLKELREMHAYFVDLLSHPELWDESEPKMYVSQWDNPAL